MTSEIESQIEDYGNQHGEPHWLVEKRIAALKQLDSVPELTFKDHSLNNIQKIKIAAPTKIKLTKEMINEAKVDEEEIGMTQIGQSSLENTLNEDDEDNGVILTDIFTAFRQHPQLIQNNFMTKIIATNKSKDTVVNAALFNNGIFMYLPKNYHLDDKVILNIIQDSLHDQPLITHIFIYADEGSFASITADLKTIGTEKNLANVVIEVLARPDSRIDFNLFSHFGLKTTSYIYTDAKISRNANVNWNIALLNKGDTVADLESTFAHKTSKSIMQVLSQQQKLDSVAVITKFNTRYPLVDSYIDHYSVAEDGKMQVENYIDDGEHPIGSINVIEPNTFDGKKMGNFYHQKLFNRSIGISSFFEDGASFTIVNNTLLSFNRIELENQFGKMVSSENETIESKATFRRK